MRFAALLTLLVALPHRPSLDQKDRVGLPLWERSLAERREWNRQASDELRLWIRVPRCY